MTKELKPCPVCGGDAGISGIPGCRFIQCKDCKASTDDKHEDRAIAAWNCRADDWRDIESAPRDGAMFLAYEGGDVYGYQFYEEDEGGVEWASLCGQPVAYSPDPTHWKPLGPLPTPPEGE